MDDGDWNTERLIIINYNVQKFLKSSMEYGAAQRKGDTTYLDYESS